jgi:phosphotransferase system  glucose/maltose/N-acetylglucosamine-specific IIC component
MIGLYLFISIIVVMLNMLLSTIMPCLLKDHNEPLLYNIKKVFNNNKSLIMTNSIILGLTVFVALLIAPEINGTISNLTGLSIISSSSESSDSNNIYNNLNDMKLYEIQNLARLKNNR